MSTPPPPGPGGKYCKLCPGDVYGPYESNARINFREGSFDGKLKVLFRFLQSKEIGGQLALHPPRPFFPNPSDKNLERQPFFYK